MNRLIDLTGQKFNRLTIIELYSTNPTKWLCICDCGKETIVESNNIKNGNTKSCGCLRNEKIKKLSTKHGHCKNKLSRIYKVWRGMIARCTNPNINGYKNYGGRGITVCKRWLEFENFLKDMGEPPTNKHQIDRINNEEGYYKKNCRWVLPKENNRNRRDSFIIEYNNKKQCASELAQQYNIKPNVFIGRLKLGWSIKKALETPIRKHEKYKNKGKK